MKLGLFYSFVELGKDIIDKHLAFHVFSNGNRRAFGGRQFHIEILLYPVKTFLRISKFAEPLLFLKMSITQPVTLDLIR